MRRIVERRSNPQAAYVDERWGLLRSTRNDIRRCFSSPVGWAIQHECLLKMTVECRHAF